MNTELTGDSVHEIFFDCFLNEDDTVENAVEVEGITKARFDPERLEARKAEIEGLLAELPDDFMKSKGGGMSFLNACMDRHGNQWTSFHQTMEQLFLLGMAIGKVELVLSQDMWNILPGGIPYYAVVDQEANGSEPQPATTE